MLSFFSSLNFSPLPFPKLCLDTQKGFFCPFSFLSWGSDAGAEGNRACAAHPPFQWLEDLPTGAGGLPGVPPIQDCSLPLLWICQALFRDTFITEGHGPSPRLSDEKAFESCRSLSPSSPEPHTDPLHTSSRLSLEASLLPGVDKER